MKVFIFSLIFSVFILGCIFVYDPAISYKPVKGTYVSLAPSITEMIYAVGAQEKLAAVTMFCDYPQAALRKPKVSTAFYVNKEAVLKIKPEIIFALEYQEPMVEYFKNLNIKVIILDFRNLEEMHESILQIGKLTDKEENARALVKKLEVQEEWYKAKDPKTILYVQQLAPIITIGGDSFISDLIEKAGHKNVTGDMHDGYPIIGVEHVVYTKPDLIIVPDELTQEYFNQFVDSQFEILRYEDRAFVSRAGPRIVKAIKYFASL